MKKNQIQEFDNQGVLRCARYAFMPNRLDFCGPRQSQELLELCASGKGNLELMLMLKQFQMLYPYLLFVARATGIKDPFDERVVEAYWLGGGLAVQRHQLIRHLVESQELKKKLSAKELERLAKGIILKVPLPTHNFQIIEVWRRAGRVDIYDALKKMDACRVSWGEIQKVNSSFLRLERRPLIIWERELGLSPIPATFDAEFQLGDYGFVKNPQEGQWVSIHHGFACEIINEDQVVNLEACTKQAIELANRK